MKRGKRLLAALLGGLLIGLLPLGALAEEAPAVIVDIEGGETAEALMAEDADEVWEPVGTVPADTAALDDRLGDHGDDAAAGDGGAR